MAWFCPIVEKGEDGSKRPNSAFQAVLLKRRRGEEEEEEEEEGICGRNEEEMKVFDVVKTEVRKTEEEEEEDDLAEYRVGARDAGGAGHDVAPALLRHARDKAAEAEGGDFVYDLYYSAAEGEKAKLDLSFVESFLDVQPYR